MNYEIGPIRPPSESQSLLIRVTRGCHWNRCKFCGLYKECRFTSYARVDSILRKSEGELLELKDAGLNHLYCGMESASDNVLKMVNKGVTADQVIAAGVRAKNAGMILSDFILLGIGGRHFSDENAILTAKALNIIKPDYIRVHATAIKPDTEMGAMLKRGEFELQSEEEIVREQRLFIENLGAIDSYYVNEHIVNLLLEIRGHLSTDKDNMLSIIDTFLAMSEENKENFAIGRRINQYYVLADMDIKRKRMRVNEYVDKLKKQGVDLSLACNVLRSQMI